MSSKEDADQVFTNVNRSDWVSIPQLPERQFTQRQQNQMMTSFLDFNETECQAITLVYILSAIGKKFFMHYILDNAN